MNNCKKAYKIYKDHELKGYLLGSLHAYISPLEFDALQKKLTAVIEQVDDIFTECQLPHHSVLQYGVERAVLSGVEMANKNNSLNYFESAIFQHAMLNSSVWLGTKIVPLPWLKYNLLIKNPVLWFRASKATHIFIKFYNIVYNLFTGNAHSFALQQFAQEQHKQLVTLMNTYKSGNACALSDEETERYLLINRNKNALHLIQKNIESGRTSLYVLGVSHLPGTTGIVSLLLNEGYSLEPWDIDNISDITA